MGACCSISRQALILSRRQTQQSCSLDASTRVSAPHTEHLQAFFKRSGEMDCLACSSISAGMTGSGFGCNFRFIETQCTITSDYTMTESGLGNKRTALSLLSCLRHLHDNCHFQR